MRAALVLLLGTLAASSHSAAQVLTSPPKGIILPNCELILSQGNR